MFTNIYRKNLHDYVMTCPSPHGGMMGARREGRDDAPSGGAGASPHGGPVRRGHPTSARCWMGMIGAAPMLIAPIRLAGGPVSEQILEIGWLAPGARFLTHHHIL